MVIANRMKQDLITARNDEKGSWSEDAEKVEQKLQVFLVLLWVSIYFNEFQQILNDSSLTREQEAIALDAVLSDTPVEIQHEVFVQKPNRQPRNNNAQQAPVNAVPENLTQPMKVQKQLDVVPTPVRVASLSDLFRKIDSVKSQALFQG